MKNVFALAALFPMFLEAQSSSTPAAPAPPHSTLRGVAVDSVRGGFLKGASVAVVGPSRMALTDSLGRFSIDSIPPGSHRIALMDDLLDSLSISVVSVPTAFVDGDTVEMILAIPSHRAIIGAKCGSAAAENESSALVGRVFWANDGSPAAGANVRVDWLEVTIDQATGVHSFPLTRAATSDSAGRYKLCGLPDGLNAEITVTLRNDSTAAVPIIFGESRLGIATFFLPNTIATRSSRPIGAPVRGRVLDPDGNAIADATVMLSSSPTAVSTAANGTFEINGHRLGTQSVVVRKLGFQPVEVVVDVMNQPAAPVTVRLEQFVPIIESVVIQARHSAALERIGFARRQRYGLGRYYEAKDLEHVTNLENFFQTIPVLRRQSGLPPIMGGGGNRNTTDIIDVRDGGPGGGRRRPPTAAESAQRGESGACRSIYVDGVLTETADFIMPNEIAAIEVYSASMTPMEFKKTYATCSTVVIWTDWKLGRNYRN